MELTKWLEPSLILATVAAIIALIAPYLGWSLARRSQLADQKRQAKVNIFGALMENRHEMQSRPTIAALNLIDVAFHDEKEVRRIWREYHGMIINPAFFTSDVGQELHRQKLLELQAAMARALGYDVDRFDIERRYSPQWLADEEELRIRERNLRLGALRAPGANSSRAAAASEAVTGQGVYVLRYSGMSGSAGVGLVSIDDGTITGFDLLGGRYEGRYTSKAGACAVP